ncbi:MAG: pyridoxamine 5'-phosphate oxidase [Draconibacterium sp.]
MKLDIIRREYKHAELLEDNMDKDPFNQFEKWLENALHARVFDATAMSVSTIGTDGFPQTRIVLLKNYGPEGFTFFTNYNSEKGKSILQNPKVALHFFWPELERQIRITGSAEKTSEDVSNSYFSSRPLLSQLSAVISDQSNKIPSRNYLEEKLNTLKTSLKSGMPERPENWGGFLVKPVKFEFWQGRENRLHDRILYENLDEKWIISRLAP